MAYKKIVDREAGMLKNSFIVLLSESAGADGTAASRIVKRSKAEGHCRRIPANHAAFEIKAQYKRF